MPEELPATTTKRIFKDEADLQVLIGYLTTYQRQGESRRWDDFRNKIPVPLLKLWGDLLIECRRNGFISPRVENEKIEWRQVLGNNKEKPGTLCVMCEKPCELREMIDSGYSKRMKIIQKGWREPKPCWDF